MIGQNSVRVLANSCHQTEAAFCWLHIHILSLKIASRSVRYLLHSEYVRVNMTFSPQQCPMFQSLQMQKTQCILLWFWLGLGDQLYSYRCLETWQRIIRQLACLVPLCCFWLSCSFLLGVRDEVVRASHIGWTVMFMTGCVQIRGSVTCMAERSI